MSTGSATAAALFLGVDPEREPQVSKLMRSVERGRPPVAGTNEILIGSEMARTLGAEPGDEVVVVAPAVSTAPWETTCSSWRGSSAPDSWIWTVLSRCSRSTFCSCSWPWRRHGCTRSRRRYAARGARWMPCREFRRG